MAGRSDIFDGEQHWFTPDEDFVTERFSAVLEEEEDDDTLLAFEPERPIAESFPVAAAYAAGPLPFQKESTAWSGFAMGLKSLADILGGASESYEHSTYDSDGKKSMPAFSFRFRAGESGYASGRI